MLTLLTQIIKIPSTSDNIPACLKVLEKLKTYIGNGEIGYNKNKPYLIVRNYDFEEKKCDVILNGHIDVVPPSQDDQFSPIKKDGKLYARGSGDMKGGVVILARLMKDLIQEGYKKKRIMMIITSDEEIGGFDGVGHLVEEGFSAPVVLIPDSGSLEEVVIGEKGILVLHATTHGKEGHSARPWQSDNAIEKLMQFYRDIKKELENTTELQAPDYRGNTVQITKIKSGTADNTIPGIAHASINIRYTEQKSSQDIKKTIEQIAEKYNTSVLYHLEAPLLYGDEHNIHIQRYIKNASHILGKQIKTKKEHGASDGRFFAERGSTVILHRPTCENIHGKDERVQISDLEKLYKIYYNFLTN